MPVVRRETLDASLPGRNSRLYVRTVAGCRLLAVNQWWVCYTRGIERAYFTARAGRRGSGRVFRWVRGRMKQPKLVCEYLRHAASGRKQLSPRGHERAKASL